MICSLKRSLLPKDRFGTCGSGQRKTTVLVNRIVNLVKYGEAYYSSDFSRPIREGDEALLENYLAGDTSLFEAEDL